MTETCASCGAKVTGEYCSVCGERRLNPSDRTLGALTRTFFESVTDLDSRFFRTLRTLVLKPGALTHAFCTGKRKPFLGPVQLFLLANIIYFLLHPFATHAGYNTSLDIQINQQAYSTTLPIESWVEKTAADSDLSPDAFEAVYNNQSEVLARSLIFVMVPMLALTIGILTLGTRKLAADHLVFALHYYAYELLVLHCVFMMVWPRLVIGASQLASAWLTSPASTAFINKTAYFAIELIGPLLIIGPYLYLSIRRFYGTGQLRTAATAMVVVFSLFWNAVIYRLILLFATLGSIST